MRVGRSFVSPVDGAGGASFGVVLVTGSFPPVDDRISAAAVGPMATAWVQPESGRVVLHNRKLARPFVAHALLGVVALLADLGRPVDALHLAVGSVPVWTSGDGTHWLRAPAAWAPDDHCRQVSSPDAVVGLTAVPPDEPVLVWAWIDETAGTVRARYFGPSLGKPEDEACGSACMVLAATLGRDLTVHHGRLGSQILVRRAGAGGTIECGGRCVLD